MSFQLHEVVVLDFCSYDCDPMEVTIVRVTEKSCWISGVRAYENVYFCRETGKTNQVKGESPVLRRKSYYPEWPQAQS